MLKMATALSPSLALVCCASLATPPPVNVILNHPLPYATHAALVLVQCSGTSVQSESGEKRVPPANVSARPLRVDDRVRRRAIAPVQNSGVCVIIVSEWKATLRTLFI